MGHNGKCLDQEAPTLTNALMLIIKRIEAVYSTFCSCVIEGPSQVLSTLILDFLASGLMSQYISLCYKLPFLIYSVLVEMD